jgi:hypothetical protein
MKRLMFLTLTAAACFRDGGPNGSVDESAANQGPGNSAAGGDTQAGSAKPESTGFETANSLGDKNADQQLQSEQTGEGNGVENEATEGEELAGDEESSDEETA